MRLGHLLLAFFVLLLVAGGWALLRGRRVPVDVAEVTRGPVRSFVEEEGRTRVRERFVVSAPVAGRLLRIELEEGQSVERGALLAVIDPLVPRSRVAEAEARIRALERRLEGIETKKPKAEQLARSRLEEQKAAAATAIAESELVAARSALERAGKDLGRARRLVAESSVTEAEVDAATDAQVAAREKVRAAEIGVRLKRIEERTAALDTAILEKRLGDFDWEKADYREQIAALRAGLEALRDDLARTRVTAPCPGTILALRKESEEVVAAGTPLLEIGDLGDLEIVADFLSEDAAGMQPGMAAEIFGRALGDAIVPARIARIYPSAFRKISSLGVEQQRVDVVFAAEHGSIQLGDGYRVEVRVVLDRREDAVLAPEGAFFRREGEWCVFRVEDGAARLVRVKTGLRDGTRREVLDGLAPGDVVVLHPGNVVDDGVRVEPLAGS